MVNMPVSKPALHTQNEIADSAIRSYHEQKLDQAKRRLADTPVNDREFQSLTLLVNRDDLPHFKNKIRRFIQDCEREIGAKKVDQLYQFQIQLFPLSEPFAEKHAVLTPPEENPI